MTDTYDSERLTEIGMYETERWDGIGLSKTVQCPIVNLLKSLF